MPNNKKYEKNSIEKDRQPKFYEVMEVPTVYWNVVVKIGQWICRIKK
jgi:hypothetical protein